MIFVLVRGRAKREETKEGIRFHDVNFSLSSCENKRTGAEVWCFRSAMSMPNRESESDIVWVLRGRGHAWHYSFSFSMARCSRLPLSGLGIVL